MTLDREAARALFANAEPTPTPADIGQTTPAYASGVRPTIESDPAPFAATSPFAPAAESRTPAARKGMDWRIVAPLGVAAVCVGAIALFALPDNKGAQEGRDVATTDIVAPPVAPPLATTPVAPVETAAATPAPIVTPAPTATVQRAAAPRPAARPAPARQVAQRSAPAATAPSAGDPANSSYASVTAPVAPPPPSLGAPVTVTPAPQPAPEPVPSTPVEPQ